MKLKSLILFLCLFTVLPLCSQQISVEEFTKVKTMGVKSKVAAIVDMYTNEKGFVFTQGKSPIESQEGEGFIRLLVPHKSTFINIEHPDYGKIAWKVPGTELKKKKRYKAYLHTESIEKEFKLSKQWALFHIEPDHAILYIDTLMHTTETGELAFYLPVGKHACRIVSPFFSELTDTIEVTDSVRFEKHFELKPYFSYLTVETGQQDARILLNHKEIGWGTAQTARLKPGTYQLMVTVADQPCYYKKLTIGNAEKKVVRLTPEDFRPYSGGTGVLFAQTHAQEKVQQTAEATDLATPAEKEQASADTTLTNPPLPVVSATNNTPSKVSVKAFDDESEIWINRENYGTGSWEGTLAPGFYSLSSHKKGFDSKTYYFWVESGKELELNMKSPLADYGMLNISSNQMDAVVFINGIAVDRTPCVIQNLPAHQSCHVILVKGSMRAEKMVRLRANDIVNIKMILK